AVCRQVQSLGLAYTYTHDDTVRLQVRQLMTLGFAPRLLIKLIFIQLRSSAHMFWRNCSDISSNSGS
ncbi:hypothetical protein ACJMK2_042872, partial [Sinanodonta woodiana]